MWWGFVMAVLKLDILLEGGFSEAAAGEQDVLVTLHFLSVDPLGSGAVCPIGSSRLWFTQISPLGSDHSVNLLPCLYIDT